jgi:putative transposase
VLDRASRGWRGVNQTPAGLRLLDNLRRDILQPPTLEDVTDEAVTPAA